MAERGFAELESVCGGNSTVGSNPTATAKPTRGPYETRGPQVTKPLIGSRKRFLVRGSRCDGVLPTHERGFPRSGGIEGSGRHGDPVAHHD